MSVHRTLEDLFKAFTPNVGPGLLKDPGSAGNIVFGMWGQICLVNTTGGGARTLPVPTRAGVLAGIVLETDGADLVLTVTNGYNRDGDTSITFADAGDYVLFWSVKIGTAYRWRAIAQEGTNVAVEEGTFDTITATTASITTLTVTNALITGAGNGSVAAGDGITGVENGDGVIHRTTITLASTPITVPWVADNAATFGNEQLYTFPEGRILILGVTADLSLDVSGDANISNTGEGDWALGTTIPSDATISGDDENLLPETALTFIAGVDALTGALAASAHFDGTSTAKKAFFNLILDIGVVTTASSVALLSGTATFTWINLGDY